MNHYREAFPIFATMERENPRWVYLDSAATTQKPSCVLEAITDSYLRCNANVHRGVYQMSREATERHESARRTVQQWIGAASSDEIIFTRGTTEAINLVAATWGESCIAEGDEVVISAMEHHANLVPWQQLCLRKRAALRIAGILPDGSLNLDELLRLLNPKVKLVALTHISNVLGSINPIESVIQAAHRVGAKVLIDGAQAVAHTPVDVQKLDADFYAFSAHKFYAPTGVGVLYGKSDLLQSMPPYQWGGEMIERVTFEQTTVNRLPYKYEAGTPDFIGTHAFAQAIRFVQEIGVEKIAEYENELLSHATQVLESIPGIRILGQAPHKASVVTFVSDKAHAYDLGMLLDSQGIAIRTGHHCAQPLVEMMGVSATLRLSVALYNNHSDIDKFDEALRKALRYF